ncbi:MAG: autotransporter-associated beta strand repeat-containing protein [Verrucomicrobiota bacterium]
MKNSRFNRFSAASLATICLAMSVSFAPLGHATVITWSSTAGSVTWATGTNWLLGTAPANDITTDIALFNQSSYAFKPNAGTTSINGIQIGSSSAALTLAGTALTVGSGGITMAAGAVASSITAPITLGASQIWDNSSANKLTTGAVTGAFTLTKNGTGAIQFNGSVAGPVIVNAGTVYANAANAFIGSLLTINNGGTVVSNTISGGNFSPLRINAGGIMTTADGNTSDFQAITLDGGTITTGAGGSFSATYGSWNFNKTVSTAGSGNTSTISGAGSGTVGQTGGTIFNVLTGDTLNVSLSLNHFAARGDTGLIKQGPGLMTLSGSNTYTGATTVSTGTLQIGAGGATGSIASTSGVAVALGATLAFNSTGSYGGGLASAISGSGGLLLSNGSLALSGTNTYSGATTVNVGTLSLGNGLTTGTLSTSSAITIASGGNLTINRSNAVAQGTDFSTAAISGAGSFTQAGNGTTTLNLVNTYTGLTTVSAGELDLNAAGQAIAGNLTVSGGTAKLIAANQIGSGKNLVVSGGAFDIQGFNQTLANVQLTGGSINGTTSVLTSTAAYDMQAGTVNVILGGSAGLNKTTSGTVVLNGANTYSGGTTISAGILSIGSASALPGWDTASAYSVAGGATLAVPNSISDANISTMLATGNFLAGSAVGFNTTAGDRSFTLALTGLSGLTKTGTNSLIITGTSTYTGTTTVSAGTLQLGNGSTTGKLAAGSTIVIASGGNLAINRSDAVTQGTDFSSAAITGTGSFTQVGTGTTTLNAVNTYTGLTTVSAGELDLNAAGQAIAGNVTVSGGTAKLLAASQIASGKNLVVSSGAFDIQGFNQTLASVQLTGGSINSTTGVLTSAAAYDMQAGTVSAKLAGTAGLNKTTGGTVTLNGANTYSGGTTVTSGSLQLGNATALGTGNLAFNGSTLDLKGYSITVGLLSGTTTGAVITNTGASAILTANSAANGSYVGTIQDGTGTLGLAKQGAGTLTLTGNNSYTGGTTYQGGLTAGAAGAFGTGNVIGAALSTLIFNTATNATFSNNFTTNPTFLTSFTNSSSTSTITLSGNNQFHGNGSWTIIAGVGGSSGVVLTGSNTFYTANLALNNVSLTAGNNNAIGTTILAMGDENSTADVAFYLQNAITIANVIRDTEYNTYASARNFTLGISQAGSSTLTGTVDLHRNAAAGASNWKFNAVSGGTLTFANAITRSNTTSGAVTVTKTGAGTVVFSGTNTYTGTTAVSVGTLLATKAAALPGYNVASQVSVANAATLAVRAGGAGEWTSAQIDSVLGATTAAFASGSNLGIDVTTGNTIAYANDIGTTQAAKGLVKSGTGTLTLTAANSYTGATTVTAGELALASGSTASPITVHNAAFLGFTVGAPITSTSTLTLDAGAIIKLSGTPVAPASYTLLTASGGISGTPVLDSPITNYTLVVDGLSLKLNYTGAAGFSSWITGTFANGTVPVGKQGPSDAPTGDGISNLMKYAIAGQDPTVANPIISTFSGNTVSFTKRLPLATDLTYSIELSTDLGVANAWAEAPAGASYVNNSTTITYTFTPGTPAKKFARLKVTQN